MSDEQKFVEQLANQIQRFDLESERTERLHGVFAAGMIKIERLLQSAAFEIEEMKNHMAGITPHGFEPIVPRN